MNAVIEMRNLVEQLKLTKSEFDRVSLEVENGTADEAMFEKEFKLVMELSGITGDIDLIMNRFLTPENEFQLKRLKQEADKVFKNNVTTLKVQ